MKQLMQSTVLAFALFGLAGLAQAEGDAKLVVVEGPVLINQGEQFVDAKVDTETNAGDRVMAMENGTAVIRFTDGCDLTVDPGTVVTVPEKSPCAGAVVSVEKVAPTTAEGSAKAGLMRPAVLVPAGLLTAALVADCASDSNDPVIDFGCNEKDEPASP